MPSPPSIPSFVARVRETGTESPVSQTDAGTPEHSVEGNLPPARTPIDGGRSSSGPVPSGPDEAKSALSRLQANLNLDFWDKSPNGAFSPWAVDDSEALDAHAALIGLKHRDFDRVLAGLDATLVNRYVGELLEARPWNIHETGEHPLTELAERIARGGPTPGAKAFVTNLDKQSRMEVVRAVLTLPDGEAILAFRNAVGEDNFSSLVQGDKPESIIGRALSAGRVPGENVTDQFKALYNAAEVGRPEFEEPIELPANANNYRYLMLKGLFGDNLPGYMQVNAEALVAAGVEAERIDVAKYNTTDNTYRAAAIIAAKVVENHAATGEDTILMTHSMGGRHAKALLGSARESFESDEAYQEFLDEERDAYLAAGVSSEEYATVLEARQHVAGNVLTQAAFQAQIAFDIEQTGELNEALESVLFFVGGDRDAFKTMSEESLGGPFPGATIPTVALATDSEGSWSLMPTTKLYYQALYGVPSDGAVPSVEQAAIDGAMLVYLPGAGDHMRPGLNFVNAAVHFAEQLEQGEPDATMRGIMQRMGPVLDEAAGGNPALRLVVDYFEGKLQDPQSRLEAARNLRSFAPELDSFFRQQRLANNVETMDPRRASQALMKILLQELP